MTKKISILGCGWLGFSLGIFLNNKGYFVNGSTTSKSKFREFELAGINPFVLTIDNLSSTLTDFLSSDILIISIPSKNIEGFKSLITPIEKSKVRKVLFISSTSVYNNSNTVVTEESPINDSILSQIENLFRNNTNFESTILRFGGLFGYDRKPGNFFPKGAIIDNPEGYVNFIHRDDCIAIIDRLLEFDIWNETFNACADSHPSRREFFTNELKKMNRETPLFNENSTNDYKIISSEKLKSVLDYEFKYADLLITKNESSLNLRGNIKSWRLSNNLQLFIILEPKSNSNSRRYFIKAIRNVKLWCYRHIFTNFPIKA